MPRFPITPADAGYLLNISRARVLELCQAHAIGEPLGTRSRLITKPEFKRLEAVLRTGEPGTHIENAPTELIYPTNERHRVARDRAKATRKPPPPEGGSATGRRNKRHS